MVQHVFSAICRRVLQDKPTDLVSLIDCIQQVAVPVGVRPEGAGGVLVPIDITIFSMWTRADRERPEEGTARVQIELPSGDLLFGREFPVELSAATFVRITLPMVMHPFTTPGRYQHIIEVRQDDGTWHEVARLPIDFAAAPLPAVAPQITPN